MKLLIVQIDDGNVDEKDGYIAVNMTAQARLLTANLTTAYFFFTNIMFCVYIPIKPLFLCRIEFQLADKEDSFKNICTAFFQFDGGNVDETDGDMESNITAQVRPLICQFINYIHMYICNICCV